MKQAITELNYENVRFERMESNKFHQLFRVKSTQESDLGGIWYDEKNKELTLANYRSEFELDYLLAWGKSYKNNTTIQSSDKVGEGLKLGCIALIREGCKVVYHTHQWCVEIVSGSN